MKILAAVTTLAEAKELLALGADEIYCGVLSNKRFSKHIVGGYNHRENTTKYNFSKIEDIYEVIRIAHEQGKQVSFVMNEIGYTPEEVAMMKRDVLSLVEKGLDSVIVADIALLSALKDVDVDVVLSSLANCFNTAAVDFFSQFNPARVVLPQHMTAEEVSVIAKHTGVELEVFFHEVANCINADGMCLYHAPRKGVFEPIEPYALPCLLCCDVTDVKTHEPASFQTNKAPRFDSYEALYDFHRMGIAYVKLGSRGSTTEKKIKQFRLLKSLVDTLNEEGLDKDAFVAYAQGLTGGTGALL